MPRWMYCKYCYKNVLPRLLVEEVDGQRYVMEICSECEAGLTPPEPATSKTKLYGKPMFGDQRRDVYRWLIPSEWNTQ